MKNIYTINLNLDKSRIPYFSSTLLEKIEENIKENKKIILYLNRRWEFSSMICTDCQKIYKCPNCDISLSVHKNPSFLLCHHCWYSENISLKCDNCKSTNLKKVWIWTEQLETNLIKLFPNVDIFRFDLDSIRNKTSKKEALENLQKAQIIIWTKMITTWFDFDDVWLIWVILLEQELQIPDYKTEENLYSNIKQLIWRWWRKWSETDILLQTFIPENNIIKSLTEKNYKDFFKEVIEERKIFLYPPFIEMATIEYRDKNTTKSLDFISQIKLKLDILNIDNLYNIELSTKAIKRNNEYIYRIFVKWNNIREFLQNIKKEIFKNSNLIIKFE